MATGALRGRKANIAITPTTGNQIFARQARNWSLELTQEMIDASSADSSGWNEHIPGQRGWVFRAEEVYGTGNTGAGGDIRRFVNALTAGGNIAYFRLALGVASTSAVFTPSSALGMWRMGSSTGATNARARITNYRVGGKYNDITLFDFEIRGSGVLTYSS